MRLVYVQTVLEQEKLEMLKEKTGEKLTKDALSKAIEHYLSCRSEPEETLIEQIERYIREHQN